MTVTQTQPFSHSTQTQTHTQTHTESSVQRVWHVSQADSRRHQSIKTSAKRRRRCVRRLQSTRQPRVHTLTHEKGAPDVVEDAVRTRLPFFHRSLLSNHTFLTLCLPSVRLAQIDFSYCWSGMDFLLTTTRF